MWHVAFSSKSVSKKVIPVRPTRDSPSTRATSPSRVPEAVDVHLRLHCPGARRGGHFDALAAGEPQLEVADDGAAERERPGRAHAALGPAPVGAREDLLGRQVRDVRDAVSRLDPAAAPADAGNEADREIGAGPREVDGVEIERIELRAAAVELVEVGLPRRDGVRLVEADRLCDGLPQPLQVRLAEHLLRLPLGRERGDRPVDQPLVHRPDVDLHPLDRARASDAALVEVGEEVRLGLACELDHRRAVEERLGAHELPRGRGREVLVRGVLDERPADVLVDVADVDVAGARGVRGLRDGTDERHVLDEGDDEDLLAGLHVGADPDDQVGIGIDALRHARQ